MKSQYLHSLIVSVYQHQLNINDAVNHEELKRQLLKENIDFIEVIGKYKNIIERSLLFSVIYRPKVETIVIKFNQDSYLEILSDSFAQLVFKSNEIKKLGYLVQISKEDAQLLDAYTYKPETNEYFGIKEYV